MKHTNDDMKNKTLITILRWIAVLPAAVGAMLAVTLLGCLFSDIAPNCNPLIGLFASVAFVATGAYTAPSGIKAVATILATLKSLLPIFGIVVAAMANTLDEYRWYEWLNIVAIIAGAVVTAVYVWKEESRVEKLL